ncbi:hypothetical protein KSS87_023275 [Heliosperma pusillum]|nr:hypothetical protein KSS87_023275 [Heliosperma pusillum]
MTRAFGSRNVVKTLLKAWNIRTESHIVIIGSAKPFYAMEECGNNLDSSTIQSVRTIEPVVHNCIIAGLFNPTVKQWVHMVCGLWTSGTRCPNVDTMSAFDVSGVHYPNTYVVCCICNRAGGSCIKCRIETCCAHFHPWCAHQKGLLQSEVEGVDSDQVGFYGRCLLHASNHSCVFENDDVNNMVSDSERDQQPTCARTEAYQGKRQEGRWPRSSRQGNTKGGCLVTQVQLDAWHYINRHKLSMRRKSNLPISDVEHDYRKEYARFKVAKGWKSLVVYKSGIHALGLYTSHFIPRGAMVVEYIGEIVGLRVADKRETEYLSGRKLQYKSACYFFKIDKEHIIDATCKGGIARFVNHSCQVVFFAEKDIWPGEEITYDYHFNHEDEGIEGKGRVQKSIVWLAKWRYMDLEGTEDESIHIRPPSQNNSPGGAMIPSILPLPGPPFPFLQFLLSKHTLRVEDGGFRKEVGCRGRQRPWRGHHRGRVADEGGNGNLSG